MDYFLARYYASIQGRFTSPDEFSGGPDELFDFAEDASANPTFYAEIENPQSLNKYQYTYNNPLNMTDDDGHCPICVVVVEVAGTVWDGYETYKSWKDPNASTAERVSTTVGTVAGVAVPGGGYTAGAKRLLKSALKKEGTQAVTKRADDAAEVVIDGSKHPEAAKHASEAQKSGQPANLEVGDKPGKAARRAEAMKGHPKVKGKDRDEYPPAWSKQGVKGASVRPISPRDNRGSGASMGNQIKGLKAGTRVRVRPINVPKKDQP